VKGIQGTKPRQVNKSCFFLNNTFKSYIIIKVLKVIFI